MNANQSLSQCCSDENETAPTNSTTVILAAGVTQSSVISSSSSFPFLNVAYIFFGIVGIGFNFLSCFVMTQYKPLMKRLPNYFLINQTVIDLTIGLTQIVDVFVLPLSTKLTGLPVYFWCYIVNSRITLTGPLMASAWNLVAVSCERYMEIVHPVRHKLILTRRRVIAILVFVWLFGVCFKMMAVMPALKVINGVCKSGNYPTESVKIFVLLLHSVVEFFVPVCIIAFCYIEMFRAVHKLRFSGSVGKISKPSKKIIQILITVTLCFIISAGPKQIYRFLGSINVVHVVYVGSLYKSMLFVNYAMSCLNPFIYIFKYEDFQKGARVVLCRRKPNEVFATNETN